MNSIIQFIPEAQEDYKKLDGSLKKLVNKKIDDLEKNPYLGESLGNKFNIDLSSFSKLYLIPLHKPLFLVF